MNDGTISPELQRTTAVAPVLRAKSEWAKTAVRFLHSHVTTEEVAQALSELDTARAELRRTDGAE